MWTGVFLFGHGREFFSLFERILFSIYVHSFSKYFSPFTFKYGKELTRSVCGSIKKVALAIMKAMTDKEATVPLKVDALVSALDVLQGCCLLHYPSKGLIGIDTRAIKLMLSRLDTFCRMYGGKLSEKKNLSTLVALPSTRVPVNKRASSLVDTAATDPAVIIACLDCLLAILVDHDLCQVEFRQQYGIAFLVDVINATAAPKEVRAKASEMLLFLVRYFTESKDDHQQQVNTYLGEKLFKALTDSATSTSKGADKFDAFLKQVDSAQHS